MTSKIVVNNIEADAGISTVTFGSDIQGNLIGNVSSTGISTFTSGIVVAAGSTSAPSISPSGDSNTGIFFPSADTIAFGEGSVESLRLGSTGNIGIGTDNVNQRITIQNSASLNEIQFRGSEYTNVYSNTDNGFDIGINNPSSTGSFRILTANTSRFSVDSSGRVTTPAQPAFAAYDSSGTTRTSGTVIWNVKLFDRQNNYDTSNGRFTAPVNGVYLFRTDFRAANTSGNPILDIRTSNGYTTRHEETAGIVNQYHQSLCMVCYMSANDYAYVEVISGSIRMDTDQIDNFAGFLVG